MKRKMIRSILTLFRHVMIRPADRGQKDSLLYWQQTIFVSLLLTILTVGALAVITGSRQFLNEGRTVGATALCSFYGLYAGLAFLRFIRYRFRLVVLGLSLFAVGILLLVLTGPHGAGLLFIAVSFVYLAVNVSRESGIMHIAFNTVIMAALSILYLQGSLDGLPIADYGDTWWIIVINIIFSNILITQMIGIIVEGLEQRYKKEKFINQTLRTIREESAKQIRLLKSLRQMGNYMSDSRLGMVERLDQMMESIQKDLPVRFSALSLVNRNSNSSHYLISRPGDLRGEPFHIPRFSGPFLMTENPDLTHPDDQTAMMRQLRRGEIYFGSHFYTTCQKGFLELGLNKRARLYRTGIPAA